MYPATFNTLTVYTENKRSTAWRNVISRAPRICYSRAHMGADVMDVNCLLLCEGSGFHGCEELGVNSKV